MEILAPAKQVLSEYQLLVAKMEADYDGHAPTRSLYHLLVDVKCLLIPKIPCVFFTKLCSF
jgi:hypothetical protein